MKTKMVACGIILFFMGTCLIPVFAQNITTSSPLRFRGGSHSPIHINGNDNFTVANGVIGGTGTIDDPFLIEGWLIEYSGKMSGSGIWIANTTSYFIIRNCSIQGFPLNCISFSWLSNASIESCVIRGTNSYPNNGIYILDCSFVTISLNDIRGFYGISLYNGRFDLFKQNNIQGDLTAIYVSDCFSPSFLNNTVYGFSGMGSVGFYMWGDNITLAGNMIYGGGAAIEGGGKNIRIENNTITGCGQCGQLYAPYAYIGYNYMHHNGNGLSLLSSNILSSKNCIIEKNTMEHFSGGFEGWPGTFGLVGASNSTIRNNTLVDVDRGIEFMESSNNSIYNNTMLNTTYGIYSEDNGGPYIFADNVIQNNIITARDIGIYLSGHFQRNTFTLNSINGTNHDVYLKDWSKDNQFIHNNFLSTNQSSHCYFTLRLNSVKEVWDANYWGKPRVFPVVIFGKTGLFGFMIFPWIQIESHPAQQPYNIPSMNEGGFQ